MAGWGIGGYLGNDAVFEGCSGYHDVMYANLLGNLPWLIENNLKS